MTRWLLEVRHGIRTVLLQRGAARVAALLAALGVGLLTAMFAIADPYTLRDLPYPAPDRLAVVRFLSDGVTADAQVPTLDEVRAERGLFDGVAFVRPGPTLRILGSEGAMEVQVFQISDDFFRIVGLPAPSPSDWTIGSNARIMPAVLTAEGRRRFPGEMGRVGAILQTDQVGLRVLGHLPQGFIVPSAWGPIRADVLVPIPVQDISVVSAEEIGRDGRRFAADPLPLLTKLSPAITAEIVRERLARPLPSGRRLDVRVESLRASMLGGTRQLSWGALAAGLLVLLTCAANVGNLMLVRAAYRTREIRTREALGASRADIARLWIVESVVIAVVAIGGGLAVAAATLIAINQTIPAAFVMLGVPALTFRVAMFAVFSAALVLVIGLLPVAVSTIRGGRSRNAAATKTAVSRRWRLLFMALQAAMAMILAIGAGLLLRSYHALTTQETGFDRASAAVTVTYPVVARSTSELRPTVTETIERLALIPGVRHVGATSGEVVTAGMSSGAITIRGQRMSMDFGFVTPGFFDAAGMQVLAGRSLSNADAGWQGVVVNQALAKARFPDGDALGQPVLRGGRQAMIVGIVHDVFDKSLDLRPSPTLYAILEGALTNVTYVMSPGAAAKSEAPAVRRAVASVNAMGLTGEVQTISARYDATIRDRTFATLVLTLFGIAGAAVCVTGVAGLVGFVVNRRTSEISLRMVLGATPARIRWLVVRDTLGAAVSGAAVGVALGRTLSRSLEHLVYGIAPGDWGTTFAAAAVLFAIVIIGTLIPTRRAMRLDPAAALRVE